MKKITLMVVLISFICNSILGKDNLQKDGYDCNKTIHDFLNNFQVYTEKEAQAKILELNTMTNNNHIELVSEFVCFTSQANDVAQAMLPAGLIKIMKISKEELFYGITPCLSSKNKNIQTESYQWLSLFEDVENPQERFLFYEKMLRKDDKKVPLVLVDYMYTKSPELALSTMANVYMSKHSAAELMSQIKTTSDWKKHSRYSSWNVKIDSKTLATFSQKTEWWIQLYVAKQLVRDTTLCSPELLKNLKQSKHPLVIQTLQEIEAKIEKEKSLESLKN